MPTSLPIQVPTALGEGRGPGKEKQHFPLLSTWSEPTAFIILTTTDGKI